MANDLFSTPLQSILAPLMNRFLQEKHACGYYYREPSRIIWRLDGFLVQEGLATCELPRFIVQKWLAKRTHESSATHQSRFVVVRQFCRFLCRLGYPVYMPDSTLLSRAQSTFVPRIFTHEQIRKLLQSVDVLEPTGRSPLRHLIMPEVFRLLYGCGFRVGEVLRLRVQEVDLDRGLITVRQGKFRKNRQVPVALSLVKRLREYTALFGNWRLPGDIFFPARNGTVYTLLAVYRVFRQLLIKCRIPHAGRGKGPRIHDLRHTFAVHTLLRWYRNGEDLDAKLPLLATYLGHQNLLGTQRYLHLTAELFPEITKRVEALFGEVIPRRSEV